MVDDEKDNKPKDGKPKDDDAPKVHDKRKIDPETGEARQSAPPVADSADPAVDEAPTDVEDIEILDAQGTDTEFTDEDLELLAETERDLVSEYRERAARAEAELKNFRTRVERDRQAN